MNINILQSDNVTKRFGGVVAADEVSFRMKQHEILGLIGPNGAGKTTMFNLITGLDTPDEGEIRFNGRSIARMSAHQVVRTGIARTFQNIRLLGHLSVLDNVKIAFHIHIQYGLMSAALRLPRYFREERMITEKSRAYLELLHLDKDRHLLASSLPYGSRRKLEIARAMATGANLLLFDEPAAGMNPQETSELMTIIRRINREYGLSILLIEHDMRLVMSLCERLVVMDHGKVIATGEPNVVKCDCAVIEAYLGVKK